MLLKAKAKGLSYPQRRAWIDKEYLLPIKEELYAKSGKLLKTATMDGIKKIQGRWFPSRFLFKDELKRNSKGTEWQIVDIQFDVDIPDRRFSKSNLRK
jgi:outer membrane lipoprotein-sorting protein